MGSPRFAASGRALVCFVGLLMSPTCVRGATFYVRANGSDSADGLSPVTAWVSIRKAVRGAANPGDLVVVGPGRYVEGDIEPAGSGTPTKPIQILADPDGTMTGDPSGVVVVDANRSFATGFHISKSHDLVVAGFHITNALTAGIQVRGSAGVTTPTRILIENNVIFSNGDTLVGRGIDAQNAQEITVLNNLIYANTSTGVSAGGDNGVQDLHLINNTIYQHGYAGIVIGQGGGAGSTGAWLINNIVAASGQFSVDVNAVSRCNYVAAYNLFADVPSSTTPSDVTNLPGPSPFTNPAGVDGILGGDGFADDDFSLPQIATGQEADSVAVDAGADSATAFGLDQASTRDDGVADAGRVDLGFHRGNASYPGFAGVPLPRQVLYVRAAGNDSYDGLTPAHALRTITRAAALARANSTIIVGPGRYAESNVGLSSLDPAGPVAFIADSGGDATGDAAAPVLVDAGGDYAAFVVTGHCSTVIDGFAVTNSATAGIVVDTSSGSVVRNNIVFSNLRRGIEVDDSSFVQVVNNLVYENGTGGIQIGGTHGSRRVTIQNNTVYHSAQLAIAIGLDNSPSPAALVQYNILDSNGALDNRVSIQVGSDSISGYTARYNINTDDYAAGTPHPTTDLVSSPLFVNPSGTDRVLGGAGFADDDFHLRQIGAGQEATSPAVDDGPVTAKSAGMSQRSTRSDGVVDTDFVDLGFHYPAFVASILYVSPDGSDLNSGLSDKLPLRTIAQALKRASAGMQVQLAPGHYVETALRPSAGVTIAGPDNAAALIDANGGSIAFDVREPNVTLMNVGVTGGSSAGVRVRADTFQLVNCRIFGNPGKGVFLSSGANDMAFNNAIYANGNTGVVIGDSIAAPTQSAILHNTIYGNNFGITVGLSVPTISSDTTILNNLVSGNRRDGISVGAPSAATLQLAYNCNSDGYAGISQPPSDIVENPLLLEVAGVDLGSYAEGNTGGFYLSQFIAGQLAQSPCVDAGVGSPEQLNLNGGTTRTDDVPDRGWVDIGFHNQRSDAVAPTVAALVHACRNGCYQLMGDCNQDGRVTVDELIVAVNIALGSAPLSSCTGVDRDGDGRVSINELVGAVHSALGG